MTHFPSSRSSFDLRVQDVSGVLDWAGHALGVSFAQGSLVRKRRSIGVRTTRSTWVRVERRPLDRSVEQGVNGVETAAALKDVAMPEWYAGAIWPDPDSPAQWRADEMQLLPDPPVRSGGTLLDDPKLPEHWWTSLTSSLDALAAQSSERIATPDTVTITRAGVAGTIQKAFSSVVGLDLQEWVPAHADLNWANMTAPEFCLFDWEDWGMAPRGLDAASLWSSSLAVPAVADRVWRERRADLECREGLVMALFCCAKIVGEYADPAHPCFEPARREAERLLAELQAR